MSDNLPDDEDIFSLELELELLDRESKFMFNDDLSAIKSARNFIIKYWLFWLVVAIWLRNMTAVYVFTGICSLFMVVGYFLLYRPISRIGQPFIDKENFFDSDI